MELGKFFKRLAMDGVQPYFLFTEDGRLATLEKSQGLSYETIDRMVTHGKFTMPRITIHVSSKLSQSEILLCFNSKDAYPISGFPRSLVAEVKPRGKLSLLLSTNTNIPYSLIIQRPNKPPHRIPSDGLEAPYAASQCDKAGKLPTPRTSNYHSQSHRTQTLSWN